MKRLPSIVLGISGLAAMLFGFQHPETSAIGAAVVLQISAVASLLFIGSAEAATIASLRAEIVKFDDRIRELATTLRERIDADNAKHLAEIAAIRRDAAQTREVLNTVTTNHPSLMNDPYDFGFNKKITTK